MGRNAKDSKWYATPPEARKRPQIKFTLPPRVIALLDAMAGPGLRSAFVETLVLEEARRRGVEAPPEDDGPSGAGEP